MKILIYTLIITVSLTIIAVIFFYKYFIKNSIPVTSPIPNPVSTISPTTQPENGRQFCIQVITPAKNPVTRECREFPTPCDVPDSWEQIPGC